MRLVALLLGGSLLLWSCGGSGSRGTVVAIVGDSITRAAAPALKSDFRYVGLDLHAEDHQRIDEMLPQLRVQLQRNPDAVVINLGTNDAIQARQHPDWRTAFDTVWKLVQSRPCVVYATINTFADTLRGHRTVAADINHEIRLLAAAHRNVRIVDWDAAVQADQSLLAGSGKSRSDMIHPMTPRAKRWIATHYRNAVRSCGLQT